MDNLNTIRVFFFSLSRSQGRLWGNGSKWRGRELTGSVLGQNSRLVLLEKWTCVNYIFYLPTDGNSCGFDNMGGF